MLSFIDYHSRFESNSRKLGGSLAKLSNHGWAAQWGSEPFIVILSGLHGDEISGPLAILQWLDSNLELAMRNSPFVPPVQGLIIIPLINDLGWSQNQRSWQNLDLNRSFNYNAPNMIIDIMDILASKQIALFLDIHEDDQIEHPYIYNYTLDTHTLAVDLATHLAITPEPWSDPSEWETSSDLFVRRIGCPYSLTLETPSQWPLTKRIEMNIKAIEWLMKYQMNTYPR